MESATKPAHPDEVSGESSELPTGVSQKDVESLLKASREAQDPHVALEYAQRAIDALPDDPQVQENVQRSVFTKLSQDAFVAFLAETDKHYVITFRNSRPVVVPKARTQPEIFPEPKRTEGERALGMLWWLMLGLVPVGIGALILSPLTAGRAVDILWRKDMDSREKRLAWVTFFLAGVLGLLGMIFTLLLVLHLIG
jgi:hypothetical protein